MAIQRLKILALCSWYPNDFNPTLGNFVKKHAEAASLYNDVVSLSVFPSLLDKKIRLVETRTRTFSEIVVYYPKTTSKFRLWNMFRNYFAHRKAFKKGEIVDSDDFCFRKPAGGLSWEDRYGLAGKELNRDVELGELVKLDFFKLKDL